jgi:hypothetical protein
MMAMGAMAGFVPVRFGPHRRGERRLRRTEGDLLGRADLRTACVTLSGVGKLVAFEWERPGLRLNWQ